MERPTHVLFDFFGTLVGYSDSLVEQGFPESYAILVAAGARPGYDELLEQWAETVGEFEARAEESLDEFSMDEICGAFLERVLPQPPDDDLVVRFRDSYLCEWSKGIERISGVSALLADLTQRFKLALVSNTYRAEFVLDHLRTMDIDRFFDTIVTSIEHGKRKPSPDIFESALELAGGTPSSSLFIGDSYPNDYLGAIGAGLSALLIDPERRHDIPESRRLDHVLDLRELLLGDR
jgi:putative hydrolase of the HAD superfamily